eukprot:3605920-Amphidinium_carterae.3
MGQSFRVAVETREWLSDKGCLVEPQSEESSIIKVTAQHAFWQIPKAGLIAISKEFKIDMDRPLHETVLTTVEHVLGPSSDEQKLQLLRKRMPQKTDIEALLADDDLQELLDDSDHCKKT